MSIYICYVHVHLLRTFVMYMYISHVHVQLYICWIYLFIQTTVTFLADRFIFYTYHSQLLFSVFIRTLTSDISGSPYPHHTTTLSRRVTRRSVIEECFRKCFLVTGSTVWRKNTNLPSLKGNYHQNSMELFADHFKERKTYLMFQ